MSTGDSTNVERVRHGSAAGVARSKSKAAGSAPKNKFLQPSMRSVTRTNSNAGPNKLDVHTLLDVLRCIRTVVYGNAQCCQQHAQGCLHCKLQATTAWEVLRRAMQISHCKCTALVVTRYIMDSRCADLALLY